MTMLDFEKLNECWWAACRVSMDPSRLDASIYSSVALEYMGAKERVVAFARAVERATREAVAEEDAERFRNLQQQDAR